MAIYPYSFTLPPVNKQDIPSDGVVGEFLGISAGGVLDWLPVAGGGGGGTGDMLKSENLSGLADYAIARTNIGLGLTSSPEFANLTLTSPSLASSAPVTISQTWNGTGSTAFTALKVNATTTTGSAATAKILEAQHSSLNRFSVQKDGVSTIGASDAAVPEILLNLVNQYGTYGFRASNGRLGFMFGGNEVASVFNNGTFQASVISVQGIQVLRDADNTLALRNGAAAQTFNVYGTYTSGTSYERLTLSAPSAANAIIGTNKGSGGGTARGLDLHTDGAARMTITTAGNVGIGTTAPTAPLEIRGAAVTNTRENLLKCTVSDGGNSAFHIFNATSGDNQFVPGFSGSNFGTAASLSFNAQTNSANDSGTVPLTLYVARLTNSETDPNNGTLSAVTTKPLFGWYNNTTNLMQMAANGNLGIGTTSPTSKLHVAGTIKPEQATMVDKAAGFTLAAVDAGTVINSTSATAITINLPAADTAAGYNVMIIQSGAGAVTIDANGNTLNSFGSAFTTAGQHAACSIVRTAASTYNLSGNLV